MGLYCPEGRINKLTVGVNQPALIAPAFDTSVTPVETIDSPVVGGNVWGAVVSDRTLGVAAIYIPKKARYLTPTVLAAADLFNNLGSKKVDLIMIAGSDLLDNNPSKDFREKAMDRAFEILRNKRLQVIGKGWQEVEVDKGVRIDAREGVSIMPLTEQFNPSLQPWALQQRIIAIVDSLVEKVDPRLDSRTPYHITWAYRPSSQKAA